MKIHKSIHSFFKQYTIFPDRLFLGFTLFGLVVGAGLVLLNHLDFHYTMVTLFIPHIKSFSLFQMLCTFALGSLFLFYGMYIQKESPRSSTFIWGLGLFFWTVVVNFFFCYAIEPTPFTPIDAVLLKIDSGMGINTPALMAWTHHHPHCHHMFTFVYDSMLLELTFIPLILALVNARKALGVFFIAQLCSLYVGCFIYYFFPTMAPSGIIHSPYFSSTQHDTSLKFYEIHHYLKVTTANGGLIAFPSFHVVWAILIANACRAKKIIFYPLACYNILLIISTVFLGWHYFTDVIGGIVLAMSAIYFAEWVYKKSYSCQTST